MSSNIQDIVAGSYLALVIAIFVAVYVLLIIANWKVYTKAGFPGWASLIPIYNIIVLSKIATGSGAKWLLLLIPIFGEIYAFIFEWKLVKSFGRSGGFYVGMLFLPIIFTFILGFGDAEYVGSC